jgi:hypothetical protein
MEKSERSDMIRKRFKAKGGFLLVLPKAKPRPAPRPKPAVVCMRWPEANRDTRRAGIWMHAPDPKPKIVPTVKRNAGEVSMLSKMAKKAEPKKLKRRVANAEQLLAERARR